MQCLQWLPESQKCIIPLGGVVQATLCALERCILKLRPKFLDVVCAKVCHHFEADCMTDKVRRDRQPIVRFSQAWCDYRSSVL